MQEHARSGSGRAAGKHCKCNSPLPPQAGSVQSQVSSAEGCPRHPHSWDPTSCGSSSPSAVLKPLGVLPTSTAPSNPRYDGRRACDAVYESASFLFQHVVACCCQSCRSMASMPGTEGPGAGLKPSSRAARLWVGAWLRGQVKRVRQLRRRSRVVSVSEKTPVLAMLRNAFVDAEPGPGPAGAC